MHASDSQAASTPDVSSASFSFSWRCVLFLSCASALLLAAAYPPLNLWPLAWVAPIGWLMLIRVDTLPKRSYWWIYLSGFLFWMTVLHGIGNAHWATRLLGWPILCSYLAVYTPLFVGLSRLLVLRAYVPLPLAAPVVWTGLEYIRAHFATGFSIAQLGHTQATVPLLIQVAEFTGAYGVGFAMLLVLGLAVAALPGARRHPATRQLPLWLARTGLIVCSLLMAVGYVVWGTMLFHASSKLEWGYSHGGQRDPVEPVKIGLVQGSIDTVFGDPTQSERTFEQYTALTDHLVQNHPNLDLIVWPETTMGDHMVFEIGADFAAPKDLKIDEAEFRKRILERADGFNGFLHDLGVNRWKSPLLLGTSVVRYGNQRMEHANAAIYVGHEGTIVTRYDKVHPVMFGEYVPLGDYVPWIYDLLPIGGGLTPGKGPVTVDVDGVSLVPCICFENTVPHLVAGQVRELDQAGIDVDALVTLTNDGWFWGSSILDLHLACARFRAVENRRPMLVAANTGISAVIDSQGKLLQYSPTRKTTYLVADVAPTVRPISSYTKNGDWFAGLCLTLTVIGAIAGWIVSRRPPPTAPQKGN
ncbi:apolipoprotein N-acyltransferase [Bremerella sp. JC817]|uniref:apolipoprotein N-acyltransferase n=1 Tax=Bremerella sp. JC817 TaxID=3231756 RepID=UPI00345A8BEA